MADLYHEAVSYWSYCDERKEERRAKKREETIKQADVSHFLEGSKQEEVLEFTFSSPIKSEASQSPEKQHPSGARSGKKKRVGKVDKWRFLTPEEAKNREMEDLKEMNKILVQTVANIE